MPQSDIGALRRDTVAWVDLPDGESLAVGEIRIFPYADPSTHTFRVRLKLAEGQHGQGQAHVPRVVEHDRRHEGAGLVVQPARQRPGQQSGAYHHDNRAQGQLPVAGQAHIRFRQNREDQGRHKHVEIDPVHRPHFRRMAPPIAVAHGDDGEYRKDDPQDLPEDHHLSLPPHVGRCAATAELTVGFGDTPVAKHRRSLVLCT